MKSVRVGVAGVGTWGANHARVISTLPEATVSGFYDRDDNRAGAIASEHGGQAFTNLDDLLEHSDAIIVAVPTTAHHEVATKALGAGVHVLVEKPIATTLAEADEMIACASQAGKVLMVGHLERFNPAVEALIEKAGDPRFVEVHRLSPFHVRGLDVSVVLDLMIHDLDILLTLVRSPLEEVRAVGVPVLSPSIDIANARLRFANGCVANLTASRISITKTRKIRVFEKDTYISVDFTNQDIVCYRRTGPPPTPEMLTPESFHDLVSRENIVINREEPLKREVRRFLAAVSGEDVSYVTGEEGREALSAAIRILRGLDESSRPDA